MAKVKELEQYLAQSVAECFATFMLILIGESGIAQYKLSRQGNHSTITINLSFAIGVYTGIDLFVLLIIEGNRIDEKICRALLFVKSFKF